MASIAKQKYGVEVRVAMFADIAGTDIYDGIWANFSLLHAPKADLPNHLAALHAALKPKGRLHLGMKLGTGEQRDTIGRFYAYYTDFRSIATEPDSPKGWLGFLNPGSS